ncbi:hypothetical protein DF147_35245 [Burkholderia cenocepacia]|nr:hypothetical protein DF147_35245 [Burkholderia cenocepacia]RQU79126.1 hypothetical protein DF133_35145 [Burkholderia cenocepacia]
MPTRCDQRAKLVDNRQSVGARYMQSAATSDVATVQTCSVTVRASTQRVRDAASRDQFFAQD